MPRGNEFKEELGMRHPNNEGRSDSHPQPDPRTEHEQRNPGAKAQRGAFTFKRGVYVLGDMK